MGPNCSIYVDFYYLWIFVNGIWKDGRDPQIADDEGDYEVFDPDMGGGVSRSRFRWLFFCVFGKQLVVGAQAECVVLWLAVKR